MDNNYQLLSFLALWAEYNPGHAAWVCGGIFLAIGGLCIFVGRVCWNIAKSHSEGSIGALKEQLAYVKEQGGALETITSRLEKVEAAVKLLPSSPAKETLATTTSAAITAVDAVTKANNDLNLILKSAIEKFETKNTILFESLFKKEATKPLTYTINWPKLPDDTKQ